MILRIIVLGQRSYDGSIKMNVQLVKKTGMTRFYVASTVDKLLKNDQEIEALQ